MVREMVQMERRSILLYSLLAGLFVAAFYPALELLAAKWSESEDYTHAFFIVPVIGYIIWQKRDLFSTARGASGATILGGVLACLTMAGYILSLQIQVPTIIFLSMAFFVVSVLIYFAGVGGVVKLAVPIVLLFMIIPIPNQLMSSLTASLQLKISEMSEVILRLVGVPLFREGNVIEVSGMSFAIVEACSGIRSLISMTTLSVLISYFTLSRWWSFCILFLISIPIALFINLIRVVAMVLVYHYFKIDITTGTVHTVSGLVIFIIGLVLLFLVQRVLESWETPKNAN